MNAPVLELRNVSKYFGRVIALKDVSAEVNSAEVACILGDNGAGKSTLIKILSGLHQPDDGALRLDGEERLFKSPAEAREAGIATVYQDLAMIPMMSIWRNFFLGAEPCKGAWPFRWFDTELAKRVAKEEIGKMGVAIRDAEQPLGTLSGGERQSVAIARALHFGARVLILDEPTAALGVRQARAVLRYIARARDHGLAVVFITHNPAHAYPVGDRFVILNRGRCIVSCRRGEISREELLQQMSGGAELEGMDEELRK
ncbi:MAG: ATP-binding cassette domain-containing protein [Acetobacteraceae bacterium]